MKKIQPIRDKTLIMLGGINIFFWFEEKAVGDRMKNIK
jgi:hypothetical protein